MYDEELTDIINEFTTFQSNTKRVFERLQNTTGRLGGLVELYPIRNDVKEQIKTAALELVEIRKDLIRLGLVNKTLYDNPRLGKKVRK